MDGRKLDVTATNPHPDVANMRRVFDNHIALCEGCKPAMCDIAQSIWRTLCLRALHFHVKDEPREGGA